MAILWGLILRQLGEDPRTLTNQDLMVHLTMDLSLLTLATNQNTGNVSPPQGQHVHPVVMIYDDPKNHPLIF